jgi:hypothetical protein
MVDVPIAAKLEGMFSHSVECETRSTPCYLPAFFAGTGRV